MANTKYPKGKEKILNKEIDFDTDTIKPALLPTTAPMSFGLHSQPSWWEVRLH